jgi:hypothetical protein
MSTAPLKQPAAKVQSGDQRVACMAEQRSTARAGFAHAPTSTFLF